MRYLTYLILFVTLTGCQGQFVQKIDSSDVSQTILTYGAQLKYEKGLLLADSIIYYDDTIQRFRLDFTTQRIHDDLWSSRELLVDTVEGFLNRINGNWAIVPFLEHYPITADDVDVYITYTSYYTKFVDLQGDALATLRNGNASYFTATTFECSQQCWQERREYYWQSKMFVDYNRQGEALYGPKPNALETVFGVERYIPASK